MILIIWLVVIAAVVALDQASKLLVINFLDKEEPLEIIKGVFRFTYVENRGAAFGSFSDNRWVFMVISSVAIIGMLVYLWKFRPSSRLACTSLSFIIGGGIGNMIDRVYLGYVVDFLDFCAFPEIWTWVFNVADAFVCIGAGMLILWCILSMIEEKKAEKLKAADADSTDCAENKENKENKENEENK